MTRTLWTLALCASLSSLATPPVVAGGRGGGMQRGGGGYGGGEGSRGGGYGGGGATHSPSFSQPRPQSDRSANGNRNPSNSNAGAAAAGADYANKNQSPNHPDAAPAAAGAGYSNRNQSTTPNAGAAAAGAGYANKNQSPAHPNAAPAAAGAGYANRNNPSSNYPNAGAAAAGAGYANRNNPSGNYSNAGAAAAGAAYANNYASNAYGMGGGSWNGNYGNGSMGSYGGMGTASPAYGYGSSPYVNPYAGGNGGVGQVQPANVPANNAPGNPPSYDYSQPVNTAAVAPDVAPGTDPSTTPAAQAVQAFQTGDYTNAVTLTQQALAQTPNDVNLHQCLALGLFAQGNYEQAAAPLYAVLAVGPGWNWTSLIGNYTDAGAYTAQLRGLEAFVRDHPRSAQAQFVLAYQYISQGHQDAAIKPLKAVISLQPNDGISAQLLEKLLPPGAVASTASQPFDIANLPGVWVAQAPQGATFTLTIPDATNFTWAFAAPGKPPVTIRGTYVINNSVLTLSGTTPPGAPLVAQVALADANHLNFKAANAPAGEPGLQFAR